MFEVTDAAFIEQAADLAGEDQVLDNDGLFLNFNFLVPAVMGLAGFEIGIEFESLIDTFESDGGCQRFWARADVVDCEYEEGPDRNIRDLFNALEM